MPIFIDGATASGTVNSMSRVERSSIGRDGIADGEIVAGLQIRQPHDARERRLDGHAVEVFAGAAQRGVGDLERRIRLGVGDARDRALVELLVALDRVGRLRPLRLGGFDGDRLGLGVELDQRLAGFDHCPPSNSTSEMTPATRVVSVTCWRARPEPTAATRSFMRAILTSVMVTAGAAAAPRPAPPGPRCATATELSRPRPP